MHGRRADGTGAAAADDPLDGSSRSSSSGSSSGSTTSGPSWRRSATRSARGDRSTSPAPTAKDRWRRWSSAACEPRACGPGATRRRISIASKNGSRSTACRSIAQRSKPSTGHVLDVVDDRLAGLAKADAPGTLTVSPTFFEVSTAVAFEIFRSTAVDVAVVEVGLGGRFDATNVLTPTITAITSIALDHERHLGSTLSEIAFEKAGIAKKACRWWWAGCRARRRPGSAEVAADVGAAIVDCASPRRDRRYPAVDARARGPPSTRERRGGRRDHGAMVGDGLACPNRGHCRPA